MRVKLIWDLRSTKTTTVAFEKIDLLTREMVAHDIVHSFSGEYLDDLKTSMFSLRAAHKFTRRFGVQINIRNTGCLHMIPSDVYNFPPLPSRNLLQGPDDFLCSINSSKHLTTMRVLLLGATGNLGSRCLPALVAHKHVVTVFVRNSSKLRAMMSPHCSRKLTQL